MTRPKVIMVLVGPDPGRKTRHLVLVTHRGGGWYDAACMGEAKRCRTGACLHSADMRIEGHKRTVKQVARDDR